VRKIVKTVKPLVVFAGIIITITIYQDNVYGADLMTL